MGTRHERPLRGKWRLSRRMATGSAAGVMESRPAARRPSPLPDRNMLPPSARYLTKSRFKLAMECPTKLFYQERPHQYASTRTDDDFLQSLAEGGFQVGELAKLMFPGGIEVTASSHEAQIEATRGLLAMDTVVIFEGAIEHGGLFARVDVIRKEGVKVDLIEVKAKSFDSMSHAEFRGTRGGIKGDMRPYLLDVAFQRHVFALAFPGLHVSAWLMLADKSKVCSVDGLHQRFRIRRERGVPTVSVAAGTSLATIGTPPLTQVNVDDLVDELLAETLQAPGARGTVAELCEQWARYHRAGTRMAPTIGAQCARCEFRADLAATGLRSGLHECWQEATGLTPDDFERGTVLDLYRSNQKQALINQGVYRLSDVPPDIIRRWRAEKPGLTLGERQLMQVTGHRLGPRGYYFDAGLLRDEMQHWNFPLHFIDFETTRLAVPFFKGQRPYAGIAFQFSHHVVEADGSVAHRTEFLGTTPGRWPNYEFVRALQRALGNRGTVFMWTPHERTTLQAIAADLQADSTPPTDADTLQDFIQRLTGGHRALVDLCSLAGRAYFHPATRGSSSIKKVLPTVLGVSDYLRERYGTPLYGTRGGIPSHNFRDQIWWQEVDGVVTSPYALLPPVFADLPAEACHWLDGHPGLEISEGGAAATAYARLQFEDLEPEERRRIESGLKRYCELDTLAMVMVYEAWREWVKSS